MPTAEYTIFASQNVHLLVHVLTPNRSASFDPFLEHSTLIPHTRKEYTANKIKNSNKILHKTIEFCHRRKNNIITNQRYTFETKSVSLLLFQVCFICLTKSFLFDFTLKHLTNRMLFVMARLSIDADFFASFPKFKRLHSRSSINNEQNGNEVNQGAACR